MTGKTLKTQIRQRARDLGLARCGFSAVAPLPHDEQLQRWLDDGMAGSMGYMSRSRTRRCRPASLLPGAASAIVVVANTFNPRQREPGPSEGRVARYARGPDYHRVLRRRLEALGDWLREHVDPSIATRVVVDTAPLLERELAMRAGVGFIGKNTLLITPGVGSHTVIGTLLSTLSIAADQPMQPRCGSCDLCLRSCPTGAFPAPYRLDARRCLSYLTIEHAGPVAPELGARIDDRVFGCDDCQDVCPYNSLPERQQPATDPELAPDDGTSALPLATLLQLRSGAYRRLVRGRAFDRVSRKRWQRNAALAASRPQLAPDPELDRALDEAARSCDEVVAAAARWARRRRH